MKGKSGYSTNGFFGEFSRLTVFCLSEYSDEETLATLTIECFFHGKKKPHTEGSDETWCL